MALKSMKLNVNIRSKDKMFFSGQVRSLTSFNDKGEFDILPLHTNYISIIKDYIFINKGSSEEKKIVINKGVLRIKEDVLDVFLET